MDGNKNLDLSTKSYIIEKSERRSQIYYEVQVMFMIHNTAVLISNLIQLPHYEPVMIQPS
jgi:hypothetical protein